MSNQIVEVILVEDHKIVREGLANLINEDQQLKLVAQCADGIGAHKLARQYKPDVVIMDIQMPNLNGMAATILIAEEIPKTQIIGLSMYSEIHFVRNMLEAGARGYIQKNSAFQELTDAIQHVKKGEYYLGHQVLQMMAQNFLVELGDEISRHEVSVNLIERKILEKLEEGYPPKKIMRELSITPNVFQKHCQKLVSKWIQLK